MFNWYYLLGGLAYIIIGTIWNRMTTKYLWELTDKVMAVYNDERYANMLWYNIPEADTKWKEFLENIVLTAFWPITCTAAILKAEWNYDKVMRRNCFRKEGS